MVILLKFVEHLNGKSYKDFLSLLNYNLTHKYVLLMINIIQIWNIIMFGTYMFNLMYIIFHTMKIVEKYFKANKELFEQFNKTENDFINYMTELTNHDSEYLDKTKVEKNIDLLISKK